MLTLIERRTAMPWFDALIEVAHSTTNVSPFSEYELYGNYRVSTSPDSVATTYRWNRSVDFVPDDLKSAIEAAGPDRYSLSFHAHKRRG